MSDWYSFPTYNPYSPSSPYVSNNGMMPTPNDLAAARLRTMGGGGGYRNDPSQFDQNAYAGRMAGLGALGATMAYPPLGMGMAAYGALAPGTAGEADARTSKADLEALRLKNQNQRDQAAAEKAAADRAAQKELDDAAARKADAAEAVRQLNQWRADNAEGITKLAPSWQDAIHGATTLEEAKGSYKQGQDAYKQASQTLAERYPGPMAAAELGAAGLGLAVPFAGRLVRGMGLSGAARRAEDAYAKAFGPEAAVPPAEGALNNVNLRGQQLNSSIAANAPSFMRDNVGHVGELTGATIAPWFAGNLLPNSYDYMMGHLSSDPGGLDKANKAWENVTDPKRFGFAAGEGGAAGVVGNWLANGIWPMTNSLSRAQGLAKTLETPALKRAMGAYPAKEVPMDLGGWSTPNVTPLFGGPAAAVRRKDARGGYTPVLEGK